MSTGALALVGAGVRGTAALGRLAARLRARPDAERLVLDLHVIDPHAPGSGRIWRDGQPRSLVMNTVPAHSTVFDDPSLDFSEPLGGPSFAEWCARVGEGTVPLDDAWAREAAAGTAPWSSPSRALYGHYLRWAYAQFRVALPAGVRVHEHRAELTSLSRADGRFRLRLAPRAAPGAAPPAHAHSVRLLVDAVLLAVGWLPRDAAHGDELPHDSPARANRDLGAEQPIDQGIAEIAPGERVAVRGVGMGFTDLLALVTEERGGRFVPRPDASRPGELAYEPSGREPVLLAGSRSGLPFLAKPEFGAAPPPVRLDALTAALPELVARRPLDFARDVLPRIVQDADAELQRARRELGGPRPTPGTPFEPEWLARPFRGGSGAELDAEITARIDADAAAAALGARSPEKRALHVFQAARAAIIPLTDFGGTTPESAPALQRFLTLAGLAGSGPPRFRVEQLLAAQRAGVIRFLGPGLTVAEDPTEARGAPRSRVVFGALAPAERLPIDRVVDAHLPLPAPGRTAHPLLDALLDSGLARLWAGAVPGDAPALEITAAASALVGAGGAATPGLHSVGPLHEAQRRFTIIAPIPNARSTVLREIDAAVAAILTHLDERTAA